MTKKCLKHIHTAYKVVLNVLNREIKINTQNVTTLVWNGISIKVILYSYLILKKMNERITDNISTNIHNERIKTKYIPSYIFWKRR